MKMKKMEISLFVLILCSLEIFIHTLQFPCPVYRSEDNVETRKLVVATCDTRSGWKEFHAMKLWNVTGLHLATNGILMKNVCKGENWGRLGFLTKPLIYSNFLKNLALSFSSKEFDDVHAILMDSDTFWSAKDVKHIWSNYDCARSGKNLVVSTEMSCWVGRYCNQTDLDRWYSHPERFSSFSPFVNSGVVMGTVSEVIKMLDFVVQHNASYFTTYGNKKNKFDDQYAIADYALTVSPQNVAVDYHQLISASCSIHAPGDPPDEGWPFVCRNRNGTLSFSCHIYNNLLRRLGHFEVNSTSCLVHRVVKDGFILKEELNSLAKYPLVWHGNGRVLCVVSSLYVFCFKTGAGKRVCSDYGFYSYKCFLSKMNYTETSYANLYSI
jgi:hypothetical protein